jgi:hypothetical protein
MLLYLSIYHNIDYTKHESKLKLIYFENRFNLNVKPNEHDYLFSC